MKQLRSRAAVREATAVAMRARAGGSAREMATTGGSKSANRSQSPSPSACCKAAVRPAAMAAAATAGGAHCASSRSAFWSTSAAPRIDVSSTATSPGLRTGGPIAAPAAAPPAAAGSPAAPSTTPPPPAAVPSAAPAAWRAPPEAALRSKSGPDHVEKVAAAALSLVRRALGPRQPAAQALLPARPQEEAGVDRGHEVLVLQQQEPLDDHDAGHSARPARRAACVISTSQRASRRLARPPYVPPQPLHVDSAGLVMSGRDFPVGSRLGPGEVVVLVEKRNITSLVPEHPAQLER
eukprot:scaffold18337_cov95-Isochrysis_galbana.AAC.1